jgi:hypothetical protein
MSEYTMSMLFIGWCVGFFTNMVIEAVCIVYRLQKAKRAPLHDAIIRPHKRMKP